MDKTQEKNIIKIHGSQFEVTTEELDSFRKFQRHIRYLEINVKRERFDKERAVFLPSKEDSLERLFDSGIDFSANELSVEDSIISKQTLEKLHKCIEQLSSDERSIILALYFQNKTLRQYAEETSSHFMTIQSKKNRILDKLLKMIRE